MQTCVVQCYRYMQSAGTSILANGSGFLTVLISDGVDMTNGTILLVHAICIVYNNQAYINMSLK